MNPISQALTGSQTQVLAQSYLDQARQQKTAQHFEVALVLCDQAKATFRYIASTRRLIPTLSEAKNTLRQASTPQIHEDDALRRGIAETYFERGELLEKLGKSEKARASYNKAEVWGYEGTQLDANVSEASLPSGDMPVVAQPPPSVLFSAPKKSAWVDYLFEKAMLMLGSLEVSNKPSLFLVYAHNTDQGQAEADTSRYLIEKLSAIRVNLYSDQTPMGQVYSGSPEDLVEHGKLEDILTSQLCLLPDRLRKDVGPVDKVVVCSSEVLEGYLKWQYYNDFCQALQDAYRQDRKQEGTLAIREVVRQFSQEEPYKKGFHHVLTEMAFLEIRAEQLKEDHGIIPISLTPKSSKQCLGHFIAPTAVRMEDISRFEEQAQAGLEVYPNQSRHWVLFKLIERLFVSSDEAKTFLNKFWDGYSKFIEQLKNDATLDELEFAKLLDSIFDNIRIALHSQLASTVQQQHYQQRVLNADPRAALKGQYFSALKQDQAFEQTVQLFVKPRGKASLDSTETFCLLSKVKEFLNDKKVILLTGDSGAGKTTFNRLLEKQLWDQKKDQDAIPLFISLASIDKPEHDLIPKALKKRGLSEFQIQTLKKEKQKFVFILDSYDEIRQTQNLYLNNHINQPESWQGQMIISCRSEYLGQDYLSRFQPDSKQPGEAASFEEVVIEPFSEKERAQYLEKYVSHNAMGWAMQRYRETLEQPHLKVLISNPFLHRVVLEALPHLENEGKERTAIQLRMDLYDQFVRRWFERNQHRLSTQGLKGTQRETFRELCDDGFAQHGIRFVQDLAVHVYAENGGNPVVEYSLFKDEGNWKGEFLGREDKKQLLRETWPLTRNGNQYRFIHKLLLEYFVARALFESFDESMAPTPRPRRGSAASVYSFDDQPVLPTRALRDVSLVPKHWLGDLGVVRWLTERLRQEATFQEQLLAIIERSKTEERVRQAAANAMTILVRAGVPFNGANLKGIRIPGADLSGGEFDSAQLQGADLRRVKLRASRLHQADLSRAQMAGVQFGEGPYRQEESPVYSCAYSLDGEECAVGLESNKISIYQMSNWEKSLRTLSGHTHRIMSVTYSPKGDQLSGSWDHTVRLWDVKTGTHLHTLSGENGHTAYVYSVAYSPQGDQLASGGWDSTVRLWDVKTGAHQRTLKGHTSWIMSVMYSPRGGQLASSSGDKTVRLWDAKTGDCLDILSGHKGSVESVAYSPQGDQLASGSEDKNVRLWEVKTGAPLFTLVGHTDRVKSIVYSPQGDQLASGSEDKTVRLWEARTGACLLTLSGHAGPVESVVYSPQGDHIASGSKDKTVRLWEAKTGDPSFALSGHTSFVRSVVSSPQGDQLASGGGDHIVRLWNVKTGIPPLSLSGHTHEINSIAYSLQGDQLASGSRDNTVRLWDVKTGALRHTLKGHTDRVYSVSYSPQGDQLISGSWDYTAQLWDVKTGVCLRTLTGHTDRVHSVAYSPQGGQLASGSWDNTVRLWDVKTGVCLHTLDGHTNRIHSVVYLLQGNQLASDSRDHTMRLWDVKTGTCLRTLSDYKHWIINVVSSPQGEQLALGSPDKTVRLWDIETGQCQRTIQGFDGLVTNIVCKETSNSSYLVTGSYEKSVRQWEVKKEVGEYKAVLSWSSTHSVLTMGGALIEGVRGLSSLIGSY